MTVIDFKAAAATVVHDCDEELFGAPRTLIAWVAGALVLGPVLGFAPVLLALRPTHPGEDSAEAGFLRDMSTHHAQAVEMALIAHSGTSNPDVAALATDITVTQQGQIGIMLAWLRDWGLGSTGSQPPMAWVPNSATSVKGGLMPGMASQQQMGELRRAAGAARDALFLRLIRQHHLGGIHMGQQILEQSDNEDITWLAKSMVASQQSEVSAIQDALSTLSTTT